MDVLPESLPTSVEGVADVALLRGAEAPEGALPDLLVEVPHGADRRHHYEALRERLASDLPADLHVFFHLNTDVGAWAYGLAAAERILDAAPHRSALVVRCLLPRTFVDCNRPADYEGGDLSAGGLTAGVPPYVDDPRDRALLLDLHRRYVAVAEAAHRAVCGRGGIALLPHTYGPTTLGIERIDADIVKSLRWAHEPERVDTWPLRAEVDLLTREPDGTLHAPDGVEEGLLRGFAGAGYRPVANDTYCLQPPALAHGWSVLHSGRVTCLEVRRDLLVPEWRWNEEMIPDPEKVARVASVIAPVLGAISVE